MKPIHEQTVLITGATDGLGRQVALELARQGATILLHGRSQTKLDQTRQEIAQAVADARLETYCADFAALGQVRRVASEVLAQHPRLDLLINNAGIGGGSGQREVSQDGYELRFAVNYLAPFLLTQLLLPAIAAAAPARIVNVSSAGQYPLDFADLMFEQHYDSFQSYRKSKLAQIMFTIDLAERLRATGVTVNALHPASLMPTKMVYEMFDHTMSTVEDGVNAVLYVAASPELDGVSGQYFDQQRQARANDQAYDPKARQQLWAASERLIAQT